jgi:hypothetical protein
MEEPVKGLEAHLDAEEQEYHRRGQAILNFEAAIKGAMLKQKFVLGELYKWHIEQRSTLHRLSDVSDLDLPALTYAMQRLPEAVAKVNGVYILGNSGVSERNVERVTCAARNRTMFDLGKELEIIVREKEADSYDIVSCLIIYGIEARKIRERLLGENILLEDLRNLDEKSEKERSQVLARLANTLGVKFRDLEKYNTALGNRLLPLIDKIVQHKPEEMVVKFDPEFVNSNYPRNAKRWIKDIKEEMKEYNGRPIVIISSDTHSIVNCLTGFAEEHRKTIEELAAQNPKLAKLNGNLPGLLYYKLQQLCKLPEGRELLKAKIAHEQSLGIKFIRDRHDTGIDVQIIDSARIFSVNAYHLDPLLNIDRDFVKENGPVIINMDYSFGKQGRHSMQELCEAFSRQITGIGMIGKAGILRDDGSKFDIMLPTRVQKQLKGGIYFFPNGNKLTAVDFKGFDGKIFDNGPMLTVPGTVMQNETVYRHYMRVANIIGAEMEAAHYSDSIIKDHAYGILRPDVEMYVGYWASDNPLKPNESLAESHMDRGYVPLYALISATLNKFLAKR